MYFVKMTSVIAVIDFVMVILLEILCLLEKLFHHSHLQ